MKRSLKIYQIPVLVASSKTSLDLPGILGRHVLQTCGSVTQDLFFSKSPAHTIHIVYLLGKSFACIPSFSSRISCRAVFGTQKDIVKEVQL